MSPLLIIAANIFTILFNLFLAFLVVIRNPKNKINRVFFLIGAFFAIWSASLLFYEFPIVFSSLFWIETTYLTVSILVALIVLFSFIFPTTSFKKLWVWAGVYCLVFLGITIYFLYFTKLWILNVIIDPVRGLQTLWGPAYFWWLFLIWGGLIWALINLILKSRRTTGLEKAQLRYIFYGFGLWGIGVNVLDVIIPMFWQDTRFFSISPVSSLFFSSAIAYTILRHRLMDVRLVVVRTISYALLLFVLASFYSITLLSLGRLFYGGTVNSQQMLINGIVALIIAFTFQPLRRWLEKSTDRFFFKDRYDIEVLLSDLSKILSLSLVLKDIIHNSINKILKELKIEHGSIVLLDEDNPNKSFYINQTKQRRLNKEEVELLIRSNQLPLIYDELDDGRKKKILKDLNTYYCQVLSVKEKLVGLLLLGEKKTGDIYSSQDIELLGILTPQLTVAIQNSLAYEKIQNFSETLKNEINKATGDLKSANVKLQQVSKLKDEFVSLTSHELRTPMTAISGTISTVLDGFAGKISDDASEFLLQAKNEVDRLLRLVNNLLNISRIESGKLKYDIEVFEILPVIQAVCGNLQPLADERGIGVICPSVNGVKVKADRDKFEEILTNLIGNSIKYTEKGKVEIEWQKKKNELVFNITDTGVGINKEDQKNIFEKFYRTSKGQKKAKGTGLGLYICKIMLTGMKGKIWLESIANKGTSFYFSLPLK